MALGSSDLSVRLNVEQAVQVENTPAAHGEAPGKDREGKPRRERRPSENSADEQPPVEMADPEDDPPERRVDSLA
jgi:hypothetical protein